MDSVLYRLQLSLFPKLFLSYIAFVIVITSFLHYSDNRKLILSFDWFLNHPCHDFLGDNLLWFTALRYKLIQFCTVHCNSYILNTPCICINQRSLQDLIFSSKCWNECCIITIPLLPLFIYLLYMWDQGKLKRYMYLCSCKKAYCKSVLQ